MYNTCTHMYLYVYTVFHAGRESDTDVHANARKKLKEDTFFLADSDS